jgi:GNAT superfamily N-acetyltransferase
VLIDSETGTVVGYYSLCAASVEYQLTPERIRNGLARHQVPLILLARLAVDHRYKGMGIGTTLLQDAFRRFAAAQGVIGARALIAHAKDAEAKAFYEKWGFIANDDLPFHLYLLTKDILATLG